MCTVIQALEAGLQHQREGRLADAEAIYSEVLAADAANADALHLMGVLAWQAGAYDQAASRVARAIALRPELAPFHNTLGTVLLAQHRPGDAVLCFEQALHLDERFVAARVNLGNALQELGRPLEASLEYARVVEMDPDCPEAFNNLGNALRTLGRLEEAEVCLARAVRLRPSYAEAWTNLGGVFREAGLPEESEQCCREALRLDPSMAEAQSNLASALVKQERFAEAETCCRRALLSRPGLPEALANLSVALLNQERYEEAEQACRHALAGKPDCAEMHSNLGIICLRRGRAAEAERECRQALALKPDSAEARNNTGSVLQELDRFAEAAAQFQAAIDLDSGNADAWNNLGNVEQVQGRYARALSCYEEALRRAPGHTKAHMNRALVLLAEGRLAEGWVEYEWRWRAMRVPERQWPCPEWDGAPLKGRTILLHAEQGLGDTLQFARYAAVVKQRGGRVLMEVQPEVAALVETIAGVDAVVARGAELPPCDAHAALLSLPRILRTTLETIPGPAPYLRADDARAARWREILGPARALRVGIAWAGNPKNRNDRWRSLPVAHLAALAGVPGVEFHSLQFGQAAREETARAGYGAWLRETLPAGAPVTELAAFMSGMDLVISADTMTAHLAGALGRPAWTLLCYSPDWRWMLERADTPWYPGMRLFRQRRPGDWPGVIGHVARELAERAACRQQ